MAQCDAGTVLLASAAFFAAGLLKGYIFPAPAAKVTVPPLPTVPLQTSQQGTTTEAVPHRQASDETAKFEVPFYPPYAYGETGEKQVDHIAFQVLSWKPRAYIFPHFADNDTCDKIVALAMRAMAPSTLALKEGERQEDHKDVRTSTGAYFMGDQDPSGALARVEKKMSIITAVPVDHGEAFNILRYAPGQQYQAHMDTFDPKDFGNQRTNRIASFLLYLTDVEEGGETVFPNEGGSRTQEWDKCEGLKVKPRKGDALLFWSMTPMRTIDPDALHAGCPVIKGTKWVATKWLRDAVDG